MCVCVWGRGTTYLLLKRLEFVLLLLAVVFDFFLGFAAGVFYSFRSVCSSREACQCDLYVRLRECDSSRFRSNGW